MLVATVALIAAAALSPASVHDAIAQRGASKVIQQLFAEGGGWDHVISGVGSGRSEWLSVARELRPYADAAAGEELIIALQDALPRNPAGALALVVPGGFSVGDVCGNYGTGQIEDERPREVVLRLVDSRISAVSRAKGVSGATKQACLHELRVLRDSIAH